MSWFIGIKRKKDAVAIPANPFKNRIASHPLFKIETSSSIIWAGGIEETCLCSNTAIPNRKSSGWIVCGMGIKDTGSKFFYMTEKAWETSLSKELFDNTGINGHYAIVTWHADTITLYSDPLGLRRIYLMEHEDLVYFSTRLDWLLLFRKNNRIDFKHLSSFWLLQNSYTYGSLVQGTKRLKPGSLCTITDRIELLEHNWFPSVKDTQISSLTSVIEQFVTVPFSTNKKIMLSLSGGIDCRVILSILLKFPKENWLAYTSAEEGHPDTIVAQEISASLDFYHKLLNHGNDDPSYQINLCKELALHMEMTYPLYLLNYLQMLPELHAGGYWMISGGLGELMKRAYGNKLIHHGRQFLLDKNAAKIAANLKGWKAPLFNNDINMIFKRHAVEHIEGAINHLPDIDNTGAENWVDLLQLKYRVANTPANSVGFFDAYIPNYMPLAQLDVLNRILSIPASIRQNNSIHRTIINENNKQLARFPLVYNDTTIPFFTAKNTYLSKLWSMSKHILGIKFKPTFPQKLLKNLKEPIYERMLSASARSYSPYDYVYINKTVTDFYEKGLSENTSAIYDWLSFDMWREIL